jgi:hypothetical protein
LFDLFVSGYMSRKLQILLCCLSIVAGLACKERYKPDIISSPDSYLVVEGVLNTAAEPTSIRLTRTFKLDDTARVQAERNARVVVEGKDNTTRQLTMTGDGIYTSPNLNLVIDQEYRLRIITAGGKEYLSEYVVAKKTPVIDSIGFRQDDKGVQVYTNAHDASNNTRYYRWEFDETWEIRTYYNSVYKYMNGVVLPRTPADNVSVCWKYDNSHRIVLSSTALLQSDIVFRAPLIFIPNGDEKLAVRYSIMVRQYALDKRGYEFYEQMRKNTEGLGTIFDPQPSEIKGNIYSTSDPDELVIGYLSASSIEQQRYFISWSQLRNWRFDQDCPEIPVKNDPDEIRRAYDGGGSIFGATSINGFISHYLFSLVECVDCTSRGGSVVRPSYW